MASKYDAIIGMANEIVGENVADSYPHTIAGAMDALNDALAGSDQPAPQTIEQGIRLLGEHIGGGGASIGDVTTMPFPLATPPEVGTTIDASSLEAATINGIEVGGKPVFDWVTNQVQFTSAAIGTTVIKVSPNGDDYKGGAYMVGIHHAEQSEGSLAIDSIESVSMPIEVTETTIEGETIYMYKWTVIENPVDYEAQSTHVLIITNEA